MTLLPLSAGAPESGSACRGLGETGGVVRVYEIDRVLDEIPTRHWQDGYGYGYGGMAVGWAGANAKEDSETGHDCLSPGHGSTFSGRGGRGWAKGDYERR